METIKSFMKEHPILSRALIFPFALYITIGITALLFELIIPLLIAVMITNTLYSKTIGKKRIKKVFTSHTATLEQGTTRAPSFDQIVI